MKPYITFVLLAALCGTATGQQFLNTKAKAKQATAAAYKQAVKDAGQGEHIFVAPGVIADRKKQTVTLFGWSTNMKDEEPTEFFLINEESGKDFESLAVTTAKPSDVRKAIEFIGMKPGKTTNFQQLRFWPKGERMTMTFKWEEVGQMQAVPAHELIYDDREDDTMPDSGYMFTGSFFYEDNKGEKKFAGDTLDTRSIAATYNDAESLLTVPWQAPQGQVYGRYRANPEMRINDFTPLTVELKPKDKGKKRVTDMTLTILPGEKELKFTLTDAKGNAAVENGSVQEFLKVAGEMVKQDKDLYVAIMFSDDLPVAYVAQAAKLLATIDAFTGLRIEPPAEGQLFYRAFTPNPRWRNREGRVFHGWEVHLDGPLNAKPNIALFDVTETRDDEGLAVINETKHTPADAAALAKIVEEGDEIRPRDIYLFVEPGRPYGQVRKVLADLLDTHNVVFVYLKE
jgi:hypothetical protein